ncbi:hypothetical protein DPSP01_009529 [Paraphaeosphaeria sporulosa]|uniref:Uncharacterized protein n=1 Tax=Paraphaeosphaeria sporulosa TaxID=1460663 RepID=A0A177C0R7_9PLEO|nr:uncharacterized protein CC84DRAFT_1221758 [Paraphaeosphaeria sporulosa]OAG01233.1 hypothetical protein CC84DRAFT_1221758 [Paraphaeosphaeria sporulosa]
MIGYPDPTDQDFEQPRELWHIIYKDKDGETQFLDNIIPTMKEIPSNLQEQVLKYFGRVEKSLEDAMRERLNSRK